MLLYYCFDRRPQQAILSALRHAQKAGVEDIVEAVYVDVPAILHPVARFSVWAHLRKLADEGAVVSTDVNDVDATWRPVTPDHE